MAKAKKEVIVVQNREGCFLQTLNIGCAVLLVLFLISLAITVLGMFL
jgi:hypothetical protein